MIKTTQDGPGNGMPGEKLSVGSWVDLLSGAYSDLLLLCGKESGLSDTSVLKARHGML